MLKTIVSVLAGILLTGLGYIGMDLAGVSLPGMAGGDSWTALAALLIAVAGLIAAVRVLWSVKPRLDWAAFSLSLSGSLTLILLRGTAPIGWENAASLQLLKGLIPLGKGSLTGWMSGLKPEMTGLLPAALGGLLGSLFGLDGLWLLRMETMCQAAAYAVMLLLAVRTAPRYKMTFLMAGLLPSMLLRTAAVNGDAMVYASVLLYLSLLLKTWGTPREEIPFLRVLSMFLLILIGTLSRPGFCLMLVPLAAVPVSKFRTGAGKWLWRICIPLTAVCWLVLMVWYCLTWRGNAAALAELMSAPVTAVWSWIAAGVQNAIPVVTGDLVFDGLETAAVPAWAEMILLLMVVPFWHRLEKKDLPLSAARRILLAVCAAAGALICMAVSGCFGLTLTWGWFLPLLPALLMTAMFSRQIRFSFAFQPCWLAMLLCGAAMALTWRNAWLLMTVV